MKFCPGDQELHLVSHQEKVNVRAIPEVGWGGVQMTGALRKPMGTSIPGHGSLQAGSFAQKLGKKNKTMDWRVEGVE